MPKHRQVETQNAGIHKIKQIYTPPRKRKTFLDELRIV